MSSICPYSNTRYPTFSSGIVFDFSSCKKESIEEPVFTRFLSAVTKITIIATVSTATPAMKKEMTDDNEMDVNGGVSEDDGGEPQMLSILTTGDDSFDGIVEVG